MDKTVKITLQYENGREETKDVPVSISMKEALETFFELPELVARVRAEELVMISEAGFMKSLSGPLDYEEKIALRKASVSEKRAARPGTVVILARRQDEGLARTLESLVGQVGHQCWLFSDWRRIKRVLRCDGASNDYAAIICVVPPGEKDRAQHQDGLCSFLQYQRSWLTLAVGDLDSATINELEGNGTFYETYPGSSQGANYEEVLELINDYFCEPEPYVADRSLRRSVGDKCSLGNLEERTHVRHEILEQLCFDPAGRFSRRAAVQVMSAALMQMSLASEFCARIGQRVFLKVLDER